MVNVDRAPATLPTDTAHPARVYDWWLGGKDNFEADRRLAAELARAAPFAPGSARANRAFLRRTVGFLAREAGIRQFLDIGSGFPNTDNVHDVAQRHAPASRVVYVDNDPVVLVHGRALLQGCGAPEGRTVVVDGDLRTPEDLLGDPGVRGVLDFGEPVAVLLNAVLHYVADAELPGQAVARLRDEICPGSHLVISHASWDLVPPRCVEGARRGLAAAPYAFVPRARERILSFLDGFELCEPGLVRVSRWRPDGPVPWAHRAASLYGAVGRRP